MILFWSGRENVDVNIQRRASQVALVVKNHLTNAGDIRDVGRGSIPAEPLFTAFIRGRKSHVSLLHLFFQSLRPFWIYETYMVYVLTLRQKQRLKRNTNLLNRMPMVTLLFNLLGGHGSFWQYDDERCDRSSLRVELFCPALWGQFCASSAASAQSIASSTLSSLIRVPPPSAPHPRWPQLTPSLGPESLGGGVAWRQRLCFRRIRNIITRSLLSAGTLRERSAPGRGTEAGAGGGEGRVFGRERVIRLSSQCCSFLGDVPEGLGGPSFSPPFPATSVLRRPGGSGGHRCAPRFSARNCQVRRFRAGGPAGLHAALCRLRHIQV